MLKSASVGCVVSAYTSVACTAAPSVMAKMGLPLMSFAASVVSVRKVSRVPVARVGTALRAFRSLEVSCT